MLKAVSSTSGKTSAFPGFPVQGMAFLRELEQNNDREWFQARKHVYEEFVKTPAVAFAGAINAALTRFAADYVTEPKDAIYRIYRDTRFSADKTPYKTHVAASFIRRGLAKHTGAGYYVGVSHKEVEIAGGVYMPGPEQLLALRGHIAEHHEELERLSRSRKLTDALGALQGSKLSRPPKGWPADHPAAELLKHKQWYYYAVFDPSLATTAELLPKVTACFRLLAPVIDFFNTPLLARRRTEYF